MDNSNNNEENQLQNSQNLNNESANENINQNYNFINDQTQYESNFSNSQPQVQNNNSYDNLKNTENQQKLSKSFKNLKIIFIIFAVISIILGIIYLVQASNLINQKSSTYTSDYDSYYSSYLESYELEQNQSKAASFIVMGIKFIVFAILFSIGAIKAKSEKEIAIILGIVTAILEMLSILSLDIIDFIIGLSILIDCINLKKLYDKVYKMPQ